MSQSLPERFIARSTDEPSDQTNIFSESQTSLAEVSLGRLPIGNILAHLGKLSQADIAHVLRLQEKEPRLFGQTALKRRLVVESDVQQALAIQFGYPFVHPETDHFRKDLRAAYDPFSEHVDALRSLRGELLSRWLDTHNKIIAVVSPRRHEGRSYLAANLAIVFAHTGRRTLLIDADLRFPSQHEIFKSNNRAGLSSLLARRLTSERILKTVPIFSSLRVLFSGPTAPNPVDLLTSPLFPTALRQLKQRFDVILIDTPCNVYPDALSIASHADRVVMVMRKHRTSLGAAKEMTKRLDGIGAKVVGCVLSSY